MIVPGSLGKLSILIPIVLPVQNKTILAHNVSR